MAKESRRAPGYWPRAAVFYLYLLFLYGPIVIIMLLSFQDDGASLSFPMQGVSLFCSRR